MARKSASQQMMPQAKHNWMDIPGPMVNLFKGPHQHNYSVFGLHYSVFRVPYLPKVFSIQHHGQLSMSNCIRIEYPFFMLESGRYFPLGMIRFFRFQARIIYVQSVPSLETNPNLHASSKQLKRPLATLMLLCCKKISRFDAR